MVESGVLCEVAGLSCFTWTAGEGHALLIETAINWLCRDKGNCTFIIPNWLRGLTKGLIMVVFIYGL